jgi:hypothetical protein
MPHGRLPDFVIIGAMKCGTTSLHGMLGAHPDIFMSREKELHFFSEDMNLARGEAWYRRQFRTPLPLCGEASPSYAAWPRHGGVPERMRALIPEARLIYCVRDPIERAVSHYHHALASGVYRLPVDEGIRREPFLRQGRYATQLERYLAAGWREDRILVVQAEAMRTRRGEVMDGILRFLGLDPARGDLSRVPDRHVSEFKRLPSDRGIRLRRRVSPILRHVPWSVRTHIDRTLLWPFSAPMPTLALLPETREALRHEFAGEVARLRARTGQEFPGWCV